MTIDVELAGRTFAIIYARTISKETLCVQNAVELWARLGEVLANDVLRIPKGNVRRDLLLRQGFSVQISMNVMFYPESV